CAPITISCFESIQKFSHRGNIGKSSTTSPYISHWRHRRRRIRWRGDVRLGSTQYLRRRNEKSKFCEKNDGAGNGAHVFGRCERQARRGGSGQQSNSGTDRS